ncbi:MAG: DUF1501 domain-containing protein [Gemmataceae bacterium]|nr:DUF1501 domain-containing protein [Gemmataceae bacterium]
MTHSSCCPSHEHRRSRRRFLAGVSAGTLGVLGFRSLAAPAVAAQLAGAQKRVLLVWLSGALSQLESWDPKPGAETGGPYRAIPTMVPGLHISELLPHTARQAHRLAVLRSASTGVADHVLGRTLMQTGRRLDPAQSYPHLGPALFHALGHPRESPLPGHVHMLTGDFGDAGREVAFLGPERAALVLPEGKPPANLHRPGDISAQADQQRRELRDRLDNQFRQKRPGVADTKAYALSFDQAAQLMQQRQLFDTDGEPTRSRDRYGSTDFGRQCLLARRLLERGVTFVEVTHANYDSHTDNFEFHRQKLGEFDQPFAALIDDLHQRGLLASTLVVVMSEFGRTPKINLALGRDHWAAAWSLVAAGCGLRGGVVLGKTNADGTAVTERPVSAGQLFHTWFRALGLNPTENYRVNERPIPVADPNATAIQEILA